MGLLDGTTQQQYYQGNNHGDYQFTSLKDIINQFMVAYVGEEGIISKVSRVDVAFHAQRALQELSFDTFKSIKSQEIVLPSSGTMILPHDYVNYTRVLWSDSAGIKHPIYPTRDTQNPFQIKQHEDGSYMFGELSEMVEYGDMDTTASWDAWGPYYSPSNVQLWEVPSNGAALYTPSWSAGGNMGIAMLNSSGQYQGRMFFMNKSLGSALGTSEIFYGIHNLHQTLDVSDMSYVSLSAEGEARDTTINYQGIGGAVGTLRVGLSTSPPEFSTYASSYTINDSNTIHLARNNTLLDMWNLQDDNGTPSYLEWTIAGDNTLGKQLTGINVMGIDTVYVIIISWNEYTAIEPQMSGLFDYNSIDNVSVTGSSTSLQSPNPGSSSTWSNYQSNTSSENANQDYDTDIYDLNQGQRYGLDPQHAQTNGSFYIDNLRGTINFSPNMVGKTIVLDYISDSLGTDEEMVVHKFAEEAMYKWILHDVANGRIQTQQLTPRLRKEKIAAVRQAKLRLSNIKPEELTQTLRGKSKQIKH